MPEDLKNKTPDKRRKANGDPPKYSSSLSFFLTIKPLDFYASLFLYLSGKKNFTHCENE